MTAKKTIFIFLCIFILSINVVYAENNSATNLAKNNQIKAIITTQKTFSPINPNVYGMFIEHAGGLVYSNLWAEMIYDRKFYYSITEQTEAPKTDFFSGPARLWKAIGSEEYLTMDTEKAYVGAQSPAIILSTEEARGITQALPPIIKNKRYNGYIVLSGERKSQVKINILWGNNPDESKSITLKKRISPRYTKYFFSFTSPVDSSKAQIEITAIGTGTLRIGTLSLMASDNIKGWKREVIEVLKTLRSGVYRWPGGNFVSAHNWQEAIGSRDHRAPTFDPVWEAVQPNDIGTEEFMTLCELTGVEPYITVNSGEDDAASAAAYVEYANGSIKTKMGARRALNGHPKPYNVKYWNIGNEMWGSWQAGYMPLDKYIIKHNQFAEEMRNVEPNIILIASGAMPDTMTGSKESLNLGDKLIPDYLGPADWTGNMFLHCLDNMDMISEHYYNYNTHFDLEKGEQVANDPDEPLVEWMRRPANHIRIKYEEYQEYLKLIPALKKKPVPIALDEYAYIAFPSSYKVVPAYAWNFHEMFRHSDIFQVANLTFITSMFHASGDKVVLTPTGMLFKMYRDYFGSIPVEVSGNSPQPVPTEPPGGEQPVINAGSETFPLDVTAAWTADKKTLTVAVINPTDSEQTLHLEISDIDKTGRGILYRMAPEKLTANVLAGQEPEVFIEELEIKRFPEAQTYAPFSVNIYRFRIKNRPDHKNDLEPEKPGHGPGKTKEN